jgi:hypothetical protein
MAPVKGKHTGAALAKVFQETLKVYGIKPDQVSGITQDNASNCRTLADELIENGGFSRKQFLWCFLHVLNLACQAAIEVYDPRLKHKARKVKLLPDDDAFDDYSGSEDSNDIDDPDFFEVSPDNADTDEDGELEDDRYLEDEDLLAEEIAGIDTKSNAILTVVQSLTIG